MTLERVSAFEADLFSDDVEAKAAVELADARGRTYGQARIESRPGVGPAVGRQATFCWRGTTASNCGLRHSIYQLLIAACRSSEPGVHPAKGLTGEGYRGMVFWDTDIHMAPFYLYTQPDIARKLGPLSGKHAGWCPVPRRPATG